MFNNFFASVSTLPNIDLTLPIRGDARIPPIYIEPWDIFMFLSVFILPNPNVSLIYQTAYLDYVANP